MAARHEGFVGRRAELSLVEQTIASRTGRILVIVGDAGIGKSRLVRVAAARAHVEVLTGACLALSSPIPLLPVVDILTALGSHPDDAALPAWATRELARIVPVGDDVDPPAAPGDGWGQHRLFDAVRRRLDLHGRGGPRAVVVEDLQWADPATLDLLQYLLVPAHRPSLPMVVTVRADEPAPAVERWLATLPSLPGIVRLDLDALSEQDTADLVRVLVGAGPGVVSAGELHARTRGNALFIEQILVHGVGSAEVPPGLGALLGTRLDGVDGLARSVVDVLAVAGRPLPEEVVRQVCGSGPGELRSALRTLGSRHLLAPRGDAEVELRHTLLAEVARDRLTASARRAWHSTLADALADGPAPVAASVVADHLAAAGRGGDEVRFRIAAANEANRVGAAAQAAVHFQRALAAWPLHPGTDDALADLFTAAWTATENSGDRTAASALAERAWEQLADRVDPDRRVRLLTALGHFRRSRSVAAGLDALADAVRGAPPGGARSLVLAHREFAAVLLSSGEFEQARRHTAAALDLLQELDLPADRSALTAIDAWLLAALGRPTESDARHREVDAIPSGDPATRLELAGRTGDLLLDSGRLGDAALRGTAALHDAEREGLGSSYWASIVRFNVTEAMLEHGRTPDALTLLDAADEPTTLGVTPVRLARADADLRAGDLRAAEDFWQRFPLHSAEPAFRREYSIRRLEFVAWTPNSAELATVALDDALEVLDVICRGDQSQFVGPLLTAAMRVCADLTDAARDDGTGTRALDRRAGTLLDLVDSARRDPFGRYLIPVAAVAHGRGWAAELARQRGAPQAASWHAAAQAWDGLGRPHRAGYARLREAQTVIADRRRRNAARRAVAQATTDAAGHFPLTAAVQEFSRVARISPDTAVTPPSAAPASADLRTVRGAQLTPREADVLALVAAGHSNAEIGARLFISASTVGVHVSNILRKLRVHTRVEAAVAATRHRP